MTTRKTAPITVRYEAVDGFRQTRKFYTLALASAYAVDRLGEYPDLAGSYAVSQDGVGTIQVDGARLDDLFPDAASEADDARGGSSRYEVDDEGRDTYTGEDDLTEYYIELRNDEYASRQTAIDAAYGM